MGGYMVLWSDRERSLATLVEHEMGNGWRPLGGSSVSVSWDEWIVGDETMQRPGSIVFAQAMTRPAWRGWVARWFEVRRGAALAARKVGGPARSLVAQESGQPEIPEGSRKRSRNQEQEQEQEQEGEGSGTPADAGARRPSPQRLLEVWNANRGPLPDAKALPPGRAKAARSRLRETPDLDRWARAVRRLAKLPHLAGQAWVTIDFLVRPDSLTKVEEGRYDRPFRDAGAPSVLVGAHPAEPRPRQTPVAAPLPPPPPGGGIWPRVLEELRPMVDERDFDTWFRPTRQSGELNGALRVAVSGPLFLDYIPREYGVAIEAACRACGVTVPVEYLAENDGGEA